MRHVQTCSEELKNLFWSYYECLTESLTISRPIFKAFNSFNIFINEENCLCL